MAADEISYARNGDVSIAYQAVGDAPLDLAIVGGFVSHLEILWESPWAARFLDRLASFARVILWDKREQGLSDRFGQPPTLEQGMDDLRCVLDAVGSELRFEDRGTRELKGVPGEWRLYSLVGSR